MTTQPPERPREVTPDIWPQLSPAWIDEVQVAVELPMGPPGPEGPAPFFDARPAVGLPAGSDPVVSLDQDPASGVWWFTFGLPEGERGKDGEHGPPLNVRPLPVNYPPGGTPDPPNDFPPLPQVGDAHYLDKDLWVFGREGWVALTDLRGPTGPAAYAHVSDTTPPNDPQVGEMWFRPSARAHTPNGLLVDNGLQLSSAGGSLLGSNDGSVMIAAGTVPEDPSMVTPQARVTFDGLDAQALDIKGHAALDYRAGELVVAEDGDPARVVGPLSLETNPTDDRHALPLGFARDFFVQTAGDTMSGHLTVPTTPSSPGHAASKSYVDAATAGLSGTYVKKSGDTMSGNLTIPGAQGAGAAVNKPLLDWSLTTKNTSAFVYNSERVNGHRVRMGTTVVYQPTSARFNVATGTIYNSVVISNGHYGAYDSWVHIWEYTGGWNYFVCQGGHRNQRRNCRINWVIA